MFDLSKPWPWGLRRATWWRFAIAFGLVLAAVVWFDPVISAFVRGWPEPIIAFFQAVTEYGKSDWILYPALFFTLLCGGLALLIRKRTPRLALRQMTGVYAFVFVGVGLPGLLSNLIKRGIGRGRPELFDEVGSLHFTSFINDYTSQSFPSGHTTTAFAFAFVIGFLSPRWFPWLLLAAILVAVSRVAVGAHYPTDVLAGIVVGTLGAYAVRAFFASRRWLFDYGPDGTIKVRSFAGVRRLMQSRRRQAK